MLTRLEVDGFKNLFDVKVDFGPFTCIAGPNAVGKSNLFDAIEFLSLLAGNTFMEAAQKLRSAGPRIGDPRTLFWHDGTGVIRPMTFAAEMIVADEVEDDFGQNEKPTSTYLRYELELAYEEPKGLSLGRPGTVRLVREELTYIPKGLAGSRLRWKHSSSVFRDTLIANRRFGTGYISTDTTEGVTSIRVHQDGGSRGQPRKTSVTPRTVVSTINTVDDPTILAARREMEHWRVLALEPTAMRAPDSIAGGSAIGSNGAHLAAALYRLFERNPDVYSQVASTASGLVDVRGVEVDFDPARDLFTLEARLGDAPSLPARALSDGTLRFLALSIIEADDEFGGLICMEEPENGIHPAKMQSMVDLLRDLAVDPTEAVGEGNPLRQVIVNTHSPRFVSLLRPEDLLLALPLRLNRDGSAIRTVDLIPMAKTWRHGERGGFAGSKALIEDYLTLQEGEQMQLDIPDRPMLLRD